MSIHVPERAEVRVVRSKDQEFVAFVEDARPYLFRTAYLLCGDPYRAEDLVQGTFERVYRSWHQVRTEPRAYARRILVNLRTDTWRRTRRTDLPGDDVIRPPDTPDHAARVAVRDELVQALAQLPPQQRRVVVMRHLLDLSEAQVAGELGRSVGTVKSTNARGLENLRAILERAELADIPVPYRDVAETLGGSRTALRRRRATQGVLGGVAALLVAFFLAGPVPVPGLGPVALPGSEWFRSIVGLERPDDDADALPGDCPAEPSGLEAPPWMDGWCVLRVEVGTAPDAIEAGAVVDQSVVDDAAWPAAGSGLTGTLAADGSIVTLVEVSPGPDDGDVYPDRELALELRAADGASSPVAVNGTVDGHRAEIAHVARQGYRVVWLEVATVESESSPWAVRSVDDVREPEVRTLVESSGDPVPVGYRIGLSSGYLHLQRPTGQGESEQARVWLATGDDEILVEGSTGFATTSDGVEWAANNLRTGIELAAHADDGVPRPLVTLPPMGEYPAEAVTEIASSDVVLAWALAGGIYVLDRESEAVTLAEPPGGVTGIDTDGSAVAWTSGSEDERAGYLLLHDQAYRLADDVVEIAVAGDRLAWATTDPAGSDPQLHLARILPVDR
ncbi:SigE family RNA polymerase sigma factor [Promicromonospora aerolata]|uniref:SigE family RNA polymerase sigma factor n=1 Tax=Promicromonospora aerolata TaxID=195749 RepID=A0ABW4VF51_9MICO